jgi:hypothetical protein
MGGCLSIDDRKNSRSTESGPNDDRNRNTPPARPIAPRVKKKIVIDNSTIDDTIINRENRNKNGDSSVPILLPDNPNFTCSANGRNRWLVDEVYNFGESVRIHDG